MANSPRVISSSTQNQKIGDTLALSDEESHHLRNVLRLRSGDTVEVLFKNFATCFLAQILKDGSNIEILLKTKLDYSVPKKIHLIVALIKPSLCELIIEKCTELGVSSICFFQAEYHREGAIFDDKKIIRFEKIRDAALKQSKSLAQTDLKIAKNIQEALSKYPHSKGIYLSTEQAPNIIEVLTSYKTKLEKSSNSDDLYLIVGPEAGLTKGEIEFAQSADVVAASLGKNILRTETASIISTGIAMCFAW